jgi:hypothetical protein
LPRKSLRIRRYRPHQMPEVPQICVFALLIPVKPRETGPHLTASATTQSVIFHISRD